MMSNAIDFGVVDDSEEPAVYTTFCHAHICPSQGSFGAT